MHKLTKILLLLGCFWLLPSFSVVATTLDIRVFSDKLIYRADFKVVMGSYTVFAGHEKILELGAGQGVELVATEGRVRLKTPDGRHYDFDSLRFKGSGFLHYFTLTVTAPFRLHRAYDDDLMVAADGSDSTLVLINRLDLEHYVAGVVQGESGGSNDVLEYFQVQAIISRTYALAQRHKHAAEGFDLCDAVHCQYFTGRCYDSKIRRSVARTSGDVIVDSSRQLISAAFHSNCGGQTANSEEVWSSPLSYLRSVRDSFCLNSRNARWSLTCSRKHWLDFLAHHYHFDLHDSALVDSALHFAQTHRARYYPGGIPLKDLRRDYGLRSAFFSLRPRGDSLYFEGRGYGHGVGLCQEGAIEMARRHYPWRDIIQFYYRGVDIIHYSQLKQAKHEEQ